MPGEGKFNLGHENKALFGSSKPVDAMEVGAQSGTASAPMTTINTPCWLQAHQGFQRSPGGGWGHREEWDFVPPSPKGTSGFRHSKGRRGQRSTV